MDTCPSCGRIDAVRKVSAIVSGGTTTGTSSVGSVSVTSTLAQQLSMPVKPTVSRPGGCSVVLIVTSLITSSVLFYITFTDSAEGTFQTNLTVSAVVLFFAGVAFLIRVSRAQRAIEREQYLIQWHRMDRRWRKAYYCSRCDAVYIEDEKDYMPLSQFSSLLMNRSANVSPDVSEAEALLVRLRRVKNSRVYYNPTTEAVAVMNINLTKKDEEEIVRLTPSLITILKEE